MSNEFGELICVYSRAQAIEDGVLIDVSETAREAGIKHPVTLTDGVWAECVALSAAAKIAGNDESGRLWDVLWMLANAMRAAKKSDTRVDFSLFCVKDSATPELVELYAVCGPGDNAEPVITVMLPNED